jgi:5-methyltetrahydropteroyltriglutamate--homocysteine methyltransferase
MFNKEDVTLFCRAISRLVEGFHVETGVYTWFGDVAGILPQLLDLPVDVLGLDFVHGRQNWDALGKVRFDKKLGFGIVDARNTRLETAEQVRADIARVTDLVPPERLYVNPSCGLEYLPRETAFEKLKNMVNGARLAEGVPV